VTNGDGVGGNPTLALAPTVDLTGKTATSPAKAGSVAGLPGTCTVGQVYFATNATPGQNLYFCTAANTWTQQLTVEVAGVELRASAPPGMPLCRGLHSAQMHIQPPTSTM
jgi:hypothetical protein